MSVLRRPFVPRLEELESRALPSAAWTAQPSGHLAPLTASTAAVTYTPAQIRHAYGFDQALLPNGAVADGSGQTIAIVDAFDDPNLLNDLSVFNRQFNLPQFNAPGGPSLVRVNQVGNSTLPAPDHGWAGEIALDVEWAHAIAPKAQILLVEAKSASAGDLMTAVDYARNKSGVSVVSMSWGGPEFSGETSSTYENHFTTPAGHIGVTFIASSGDGGSGNGPEWPAVSPNVLSVGGTSLTLNGSGGYVSETGWSSSGGGLSAYEAQPAFQTGFLNSSFRGNPDVAYNADPNTGFYVYDSYPDAGGGTGWFSYGGTSAGTPQWAALVALANQGRSLSGKTSLAGIGPLVYSLPASDFHDVTGGNNGSAAGSGYDLVTGRGSPIANLVIRDLIAASNAAATGSATTSGKTTGTATTRSSQTQLAMLWGSAVDELLKRV
jgi:subtilase family serine protease